MMVNSVVSWPPRCVADDAKAPPTLPWRAPSPIGPSLDEEACHVGRHPAKARARAYDDRVVLGEVVRAGAVGACSWLPWRPPEIEVQACASRRRTPLPPVRPRRFRVRAFRRVRRRSSRALVLGPREPSIVSGTGLFTRFGYFASVSHMAPKRVENPEREDGRLRACLFAALAFDERAVKVLCQ